MLIPLEKKSNNKVRSAASKADKKSSPGWRQKLEVGG